MAKYLDYEGLEYVVKYLTPQEGSGISITKDSDTKQNIISADLSSKQDVLTAGTGIDITDNVIACTLDTTVFKIVESLPTSDIDENVIYVVPADNTGENNTYVEYIYVNGAWEKLGEFQAETDLSNYYTKDEVASTYQKILTTGDNITISEANVISATNTTYTAGNNVSISDDNVISVDLSDYLTTSAAASTYQQILTAGDGISIEYNTTEGNVISVDTIAIEDIDKLFD